jgi:hypothetical protein
MSRTFIAAVLAASIAVTGFSAAPARALDQGEATRLFLGATALFLLGNAAANANKNHNRYDNRRYYDNSHKNRV